MVRGRRGLRMGNIVYCWLDDQQEGIWVGAFLALVRMDEVRRWVFEAEAYEVDSMYI